mmetsp:Transcript_121852/g.341089  ORF Transcript_121852/g.341089 Transcript_121852/m.341089 type:complete len:219 (+) Transcript_121852:371-1027(+)
MWSSAPSLSAGPVSKRVAINGGWNRTLPRLMSSAVISSLGSVMPSTLLSSTGSKPGTCRTHCEVQPARFIGSSAASKASKTSGFALDFTNCRIAVHPARLLDRYSWRPWSKVSTRLAAFTWDAALRKGSVDSARKTPTSPPLDGLRPCESAAISSSSTKMSSKPSSPLFPRPAMNCMRTCARRVRPLLSKRRNSSMTLGIKATAHGACFSDIRETHAA